MGIIAICRHGKTDNGLDNPSLNNEGRVGAQKLAFKLKADFSKIPTMICSSEALRATETAEILRQSLGGRIITRDAFGEKESDSQRFLELITKWDLKVGLLVAVTHMHHFSSVSEALGKRLSPKVIIGHLDWGAHVFDLSENKYDRLDIASL